MSTLKMFENTKYGRDITAYNLFHGTTDLSQLKQFDYYEQGFPLFVVLDIPDFLKKLANTSGNTRIKYLINNYIHILEYEFMGLQSGLENMTGNADGEINNGYQTMNFITKTTAQSASTFSLSYKEHSGAIITKMHELYLRCIRDPNTGLKTYGGVIAKDNASNDTNIITANDAGYYKECFTFLYMHTDNTGLLLERSAVLAACMPTSSQIEIYNATRGEIQVPEVSTEFSGVPIMGEKIDEKAVTILDYMNNKAKGTNAYIHRFSWDYDWDVAKDTTSALGKLAKNVTNTMKNEFIDS